ncbi:MAG TPA: sigma-70 family RNA polymerase sigma factor [Roseiflexaceae bacterium]|nr:sigma-70 family RNA polymerase sigma factor [Roseiflexaceae bacterium]
MSDQPPTQPPDDEAELIAALRRGDEAAFAALVQRYHSALLRLARVYVANPAAAEEVVQETWLGLLRGLPRFEGRSSLRTWLFRILVNRAKTRGEREGRSVPFSSLGRPEDDADEPAVDPSRFVPEGAARAGHWVSLPQRWEEIPEQRFLASETRAQIAAAVAKLPPAQQTVIMLRDIEGWSTPEVCNILGISETHQRVLLHRARAKVRQALETYLADEERHAH